MFELREALEALVMPLPIALSLISVGMVCYLVGGRRPAFIAAIAGGALAATASCGLVGTWLLRPLEDQYSGIVDASRLRPAPRYVVVLGGGYRPEPGVPVTTALDGDAVVRLTEGVVLMRQLPGTRLILSGGAVGGNPPSADGYERAALALGVPAASIIVIETPRTTGEEIRALKHRVEQQRVLLVTSAAHMRRAMAYCRMFHVNAMPAPSGKLTRTGAGWSLGALLPSGRGLRKTEVAWHEYLGLLALEMSGR